MLNLALLSAALSCAVSAQPSSSGSPLVDLGYTKYRGQTNARGVNEFLGLRFAAPPVGALRWRAPADPEPVAETQDATKFKAVCVGQGQGVVAGQLEEDCLFLNVFAPADAGGRRKLPVWVYIQGGGWQTDSNGNMNGTGLIVESGLDVVHVNINYRVAQLGFLGGLTLGEGGGDYNVGLLDQWKALEWVQKYIHLFGGDPDHVVVHGTSAGAGSISHLLTAYDGVGHGLFHGVIADAIAWGMGAYPNDTEYHFAMFADQMGCRDAEDVMTCLRAVDIDKIQSFDRDAPPPPGVPTPLGSMWFNPLIDGTFNTGPQQDAFQQGKFIKVPTMVGDATDEGTMFAPNSSSLADIREMVSTQFANLSDAQHEMIITAYDDPVPVPMHALYFSVSSAISGESIFICPGNRVSTDVAGHLSPDMIWNYRWNTTEPQAVAMGLGAWHTSDIFAVFGPDHMGPPPDDRMFDGLGSTFYPGGVNAVMVPVMQRYYASFIKHFDPNVGREEGAPVWETWGEGTQGRRLRIQTGDMGMEDVPRGQVGRCEMWWSLNYINKQ